MGIRQGVCHLSRDRQGLVHRQRRRSVEPLAERFALDERHDVEENPAGLTGIVQGKDMRMAETGRDPDLAEEALGAERDRQIGRKHFDGYRPSMFPILGQVDRTHPAAPKLTLDRVPALQDRR